MNGRRRKLSPEQHQMISDRYCLYLRHRIEAARHSPAQLARELGVRERLVVEYINRPLRRVS